MSVLSDHIDDVIDSLFDDTVDPDVIADMVMRAVERYVPPPQGVHPFLDASTAHLPVEERAALYHPVYAPVTTRPHPYGAFVHVPQGIEWVEAVSEGIAEGYPTLWSVIGFARERGCWWVNFDGDAPTVDGLPVFP